MMPQNPPVPAAAQVRFRWLWFAAIAIVGAWLVRDRLTELPAIGASTTVTELSSGATLSARIDTGAAMCSIHCDEVLPPDLNEPVNADRLVDEHAIEGVGRPIRFRIRDDAGKPHWIEASLSHVAYIRVGNHPALRYCVNLPIRVAGVEATVMVTLNNRSRMKYPFLLGRNFLKDRFVVDVRVDDDDVIF
ncbi:MAG TPA: RimK/LysX family protein [Lacipirellulaceae bacterium]|nr:RimK/LysX family protein [Lacipirellulaceae bacterium]